MVCYQGETGFLSPTPGDAGGKAATGDGASGLVSAPAADDVPGVVAEADPRRSLLLAFPGTFPNVC